MALFTKNGTVLVLAPANQAYKIKTVFKLLPLVGGLDEEDQLKFSKVFKMSQRLRMFLTVSSEGPLVYQISEDDVMSGLVT